MTQRILLFSRRQPDRFALVDEDDYQTFQPLQWRVSSHGYAVRSFVIDGREKVLSLHRQIMHPPPGLVVDHINRIRLDNRKLNLRLLTQSQNLMNRALFSNNNSGFKGVSFQHGKWRVRIQKDEHDIHLGFWDDLKTAALVYDCAAVKLYSGIAWLNLPDQPIPTAIAEAVDAYLTDAFLLLAA